jgi:hypothetical protein
MNNTKRRRRFLRAILAVGLLATLTTIPSAVAEDSGFRVSDTYLEHLSQSVQVKYYVQHPSEAPKQLARGLAQIATHSPSRTTARSSQYCGSNANKDVFNCDFIGFPQNEESVGSCPTNDSFVLGSTNDYDGIVFGGNTTGLVLVDRRRPLRPQRRLPAAGHAQGARHASGGAVGRRPGRLHPGGCDSLYAASLAYDPRRRPSGRTGCASTRRRRRS